MYLLNLHPLFPSQLHLYKRSEPPPRPNKISERIDKSNQPFFDNRTSSAITVQLGKSAFLECRVINLADRTISWVRQIDYHILTVGNYTYTRDARFRSIHQSSNNHCTLEIKFSQIGDEGIYECQVSSEPKISRKISLTVIETKVSIEGAPDIYVKSGSELKLKCIILHHATQPPLFIFWYHNRKVIKQSSPRGGITIQSSQNGTTISVMNINRVQQKDSGNYSCKPSYADSAFITVHVLNDKILAEFQSTLRFSSKSETSVWVRSLMMLSVVLLAKKI
ncbi:Zwei Ig domain protein zig-8 [Nymphon striatum]|nr:Zwei Ig domain protein zig-8 [Nymphon striatum]